MSTENGSIQPEEAPAVGGKVFTAAEVKFLTAYFGHMKSKPDVDWDGLAAELNLKDGRCAAARSRNIFSKHGIGGPSSASSTSTPATTPRKNSKAGAVDGPVVDGSTRVKKQRTPRKPKVKKEEGEKGGTPVTPVKDDDGIPDFETIMKEEMAEEQVAVPRSIWEAFNAT